jgi:hypothetical protein
MHHPCVLDNKAARIDAIEAEERENCRKRSLMTPVGHPENFLQAQFPLKKNTELPGPVIEISRDDQRPFRRHLLTNIDGQLARMLQALAMGQTEMRANQGQHHAIIGLHIRVQNRPWLLFGRFGKGMIPPIDDGKTAQKTVALDARGELHGGAADAMFEFLLQMIQKGMDHGIFRNPDFLQHDDIALFPQYGLDETFLDRFLPKRTTAKVQIIT